MAKPLSIPLQDLDWFFRFCDGKLTQSMKGISWAYPIRRGLPDSIRRRSQIDQQSESRRFSDMHSAE